MSHPGGDAFLPRKRAARVFGYVARVVVVVAGLGAVAVLLVVAGLYLP